VDLAGRLGVGRPGDLDRLLPLRIRLLQRRVFDLYGRAGRSTGAGAIWSPSRDHVSHRPWRLGLSSDSGGRPGAEPPLFLREKSTG